MAKEIRVLYADDEESLRVLVKSHLESEGFTVDAVDDGDTAVKALKNKAYDLALLDIRMPRMNGVEVLRYIRKNTPLVRVIILTAVDDLAIAIEAVKNGANDYLTKPYDPENLVRSIRRVMAK